MLTIRLSRTGKKKQPQYRIVLQEQSQDPWAPAKEILGNYNPRAQKDELILNEERIAYWISKGAKPSTTVHNMLVEAKIIKADKISPVTISKKRAEKLTKKKAEQEEKQREAQEAAQAAKEAEEAKAKEAAQVQETPATEDVQETPVQEETPAQEESTEPTEEK